MPKKKPYMATAKRIDWKTPKLVYKRLKYIFELKFDPCPHKPIEGFDGLNMPWKSMNFINPPYSPPSVLRSWLEKAADESMQGNKTVALVPFRKWIFHYGMMNCSSVLILKKRLNFDDSPDPAPFDSMLLLFGFDRTERNHYYTKLKVFPYTAEMDGQLGYIEDLLPDWPAKHGRFS